MGILNGYYKLTASWTADADLFGRVWGMPQSLVDKIPMVVSNMLLAFIILGIFTIIMHFAGEYYATSTDGTKINSFGRNTAAIGGLLFSMIPTFFLYGGGFLGHFVKLCSDAGAYRAAGQNGEFAVMVVLLILIALLLLIFAAIIIACLIPAVRVLIANVREFGILGIIYFYVNVISGFVGVVLFGMMLFLQAWAMLPAVIFAVAFVASFDFIIWIF